MTVLGRLALALGLVFLVAAVAVTFAPASPSGAHCGTWVSPEWGDQETDDLVAQSKSLYENSSALGQDDIAQQALNTAVAARRSHDLCAGSLSTRRTLFIVLFGLAVIVPVGVLFVGSGRRRNA